jgi:ATP/ADP translocase
MATYEQEIPENDPHEEEDLKKVFPLFKSWSQLYIFVLAELAGLIVLFYLFSHAYA